MSHFRRVRSGRTYFFTLVAFRRRPILCDDAIRSFLRIAFDRSNGLYLLDEPEAALSPTRQLAALRAIHMLVQDQSQFIIVTHSPILLAYPGAKILAFDGAGIAEIAYEDTEHYAVTRDFLNHYPRRLEQLLAPD